MRLSLAASYLALDEASFTKLTAEHAVYPVEPVSGAYRWRRRDLDQMVGGLRPVAHVGPEPPRGAGSDGGRALTDADIARISQRLRESGLAQPHAYSIKDAAAHSGLSRSTLYNLLKEGRLSAVRVGSRTLIPRHEIEALLAPQGRQT